ncbi:MAG: alpha/beta hydrolase, partial [Thermoanaerobaculia bacterium]
SNKKFVNSDGADGGATQESFIINWTNADAGEGNFVLPAGRQYEDTDLVGNASVESDNGTLRSVPRTIRLGWVRLDLDANNNSDVDGLDREAARKGRPFAFWESDRFYELKRLAQARTESMTFSDGTENGGSDKGLADYFTARITVNKLWQSANGNAKVRLRLAKDGTNADWRVAVKNVNGKGYLRDKNVAFQQVASIIGGQIDSTPVCAVGPDNINTALGECRPDSDGFVNLPPLKSGSYELLVRCANCLTRDPQNLNDFPKMSLDYTAGDGGGTTIDEVKVEIRPVRQWITYMSARNIGETTYYKPHATLEPRERPIEFLDDRESTEMMPDGRQMIWGNLSGPWRSSPPRVPDGARDVTVVVHGYNVADAAMRTIFLPTVFKRLYWVGHPVLRRQGEWRKQDDSATTGCVKNCAYTVGISWPSNYFGMEPGQSGIVLSGVRAGMAYPEDEYRAFATGVPLAKYLKTVKGNNAERKIRILAHSLGNLAVNSALSRPELAAENGQKVIETYVMNEAAFPAEATDAGYPEDATTLWGEPHAQVYGLRNDTPWEADWLMMDLVPGGGLLRDMWMNNLEKMRNESGINITNPYEFYVQRWRQVRPADGVPEFDTSGVRANRGSWRGIFHRNRERARIYNTWSANDMVLRVIWRANQLEQKPLSRVGRIVLERGLRVLWQYYTRELPIDVELPPFRSADNVFSQNWTLLDHGPTNTHWDSVFGAPGQYWTLKRQWGELAYWFPSTSYAAGNVSMDDRLPARCRLEECNTNFTSYSDYSGNWVDGSSVIVDAARAAPHLNTHSYLGYGFFTKVFPAYEEIRKMFDPKNEGN